VSVVVDTAGEFDVSTSVVGRRAIVIGGGASRKGRCFGFGFFVVVVVAIVLDQRLRAVCAVFIRRCASEAAAFDGVEARDELLRELVPLSSLWRSESTGRTVA